MYSIEHDPRTGTASVIRDRDGARIPKDFRNLDYAEFLHWNERQAEPLDIADREPEPSPPPLLPRNVLAEIYLATDLETRTNVWNDILGAMILDRVQSHPDEVQAILDARGVNVKIRGGD